MEKKRNLKMLTTNLNQEKILPHVMQNFGGAAP